MTESTTWIQKYLQTVSAGTDVSLCREGSREQHLVELNSKGPVALKNSIFLITGAVSAWLAAIALTSQRTIQLTLQRKPTHRQILSTEKAPAVVASDSYLSEMHDQVLKFLIKKLNFEFYDSCGFI